MSGDSIRVSLPLPGLAARANSEATNLYSELRQPLLRYLVCLGLSADEAQDVIQDAFLSLHRHLSSGRPQNNIRAWLFRVTHNSARNRQNRYDRRHSDPLDAQLDSLADASTPERTVLEKEKFLRLERAVRLLTPSERECLLLRASGLRYREIAEVLALPRSTVSDVVERAIKKLAENLHV